MIIISEKKNSQRVRPVTHVHGLLVPTVIGGTTLPITGTGEEDRVFVAQFHESDLPALKKIVATLSKSKEKTK